MKEKLLEKYKKSKGKIKKRLKEFELVWMESEERIFSELCFCFCTPQSNARVCDVAVSKLELSGILFKGGEREIAKNLTGVRFHNNKSKHIVNARNIFTKKNKILIREKLQQLLKSNNAFQTREWLVKNIKGLGYKEASHFLRNIGFGKDIAILDRHILKNLMRYGVIKSIPKTLIPKKYLEIEKRMKEFSERVGIPLAELDLLFWSEETGEIFK